MRKFVFGFLSLAMAAVAVSCEPAFGVYDPRCEGLEEPLGIDSSVPRFSWKIRSKEPMTQVAYEIQVASSIKALESGDPDLWSSGRVSSQEQVMIPYDGTSLSSRQQCWWRVPLLSARLPSLPIMYGTEPSRTVTSRLRLHRLPPVQPSH